MPGSLAPPVPFVPAFLSGRPDPGRDRGRRGLLGRLPDRADSSRPGVIPWVDHPDGAAFVVAGVSRGHAGAMGARQEDFRLGRARPAACQGLHLQPGESRQIGRLHRRRPRSGAGSASRAFCPEAAEGGIARRRRTSWSWHLPRRGGHHPARRRRDSSRYSASRVTPSSAATSCQRPLSGNRFPSASQAARRSATRGRDRISARKRAA
jgi:hypothetical protein